MLLPGDLVRIIFPVGSSEDPNSGSLVMGELALILMIDKIKEGCPGWDPPLSMYNLEGALLVKGKVQKGQAYTVKISEHAEKYF